MKIGGWNNCILGGYVGSITYVCFHSLCSYSFLDIPLSIHLNTRIMPIYTSSQSVTKSKSNKISAMYVGFHTFLCLETKKKILTLKLSSEALPKPVNWTGPALKQQTLVIHVVSLLTCSLGLYWPRPATAVVPESAWHWTWGCSQLGHMDVATLFCTGGTLIFMD